MAELNTGFSLGHVHVAQARMPYGGMSCRRASSGGRSLQAERPSERPSERPERPERQRPAASPHKPHKRANEARRTKGKREGGIELASGCLQGRRDRCLDIVMAACNMYIFRRALSAGRAPVRAPVRAPGAPGKVRKFGLLAPGFVKTPGNARFPGIWRRTF